MALEPERRRRFPQVSVDFGDDLREAIDRVAVSRQETRSETIRAGMTAWLISIGEWPDDEAAS